MKEKRKTCGTTTNLNRDKVIELYGNLLGDLICNLPIMPNGVTDGRVWCHNPHGFYTSKSAYSWLSLKRIGFVLTEHFGEPFGN